MKLFKESGYVRLDDDVSFQLVRTNPKLTTNTKLMYDGENLYMESYDAAPLLSTIKYKHHRVWKTGLFNKDIRNFLLGTNTAAYEVGQAVADTVVMDNFDNQFENMYWCGVESINSDMYPQEMGCVAPLYIRKKLPNYFVIFRLDKPTNTVTSKDDTTYVFDDDIKKQMQIVKTFNLQEGTPIGNYIKKYVEQKDFKYDQSIYVNFSSNEIYYYGIDKKSGVLTQKVENFEEPLLKNDNTIIKMDDWITEGFERNNLIFPYIINLEFLFDDKSTEEYRFARYFGMYCNDIDLFDLEVSDCIYNSESRLTTITTTQNENIIDLSGDHICYIKDKYDGIHSIKNTYVPGFYSSLEKLDKDIFTGFEIGSTSTYAERLPNTGRAFIMFQITGLFGDGDTVKMYDPKADAEDVSQFGGKFIATTQLDAGESYDNRFSCKGTTIDTAKALAAAIRTCDSDNFKWITAFNIDDKVVIQSIFPGTYMNGLFKISFNGNIKHLTGGEFKGGTNYNGCIFKVYTSDEDIFFDNTETDRDTSRYLQTYSGNGKEPAQIMSFMPYITDDRKVDKTYSIIITDDNGKYAVVSKTEQISIIDKFYPKIGVLSFFPVRDFDFDTMSSVYGDSSLIRDEIDNLYIYVGDDSEPDEENPEVTGQVLSQVMKPYRFYDSIGNDIDTEYDYYVENLIPELTTVNKTTPFIAKWGYMDDAKDSCENPYRLNTSKIFETCNFSANTFMQRGDITEYTHSMPYYIKKTFSSSENKDNLINEYQYIPMDNCQAWSQSFSELKKYFENKTEDRFAAIFGDNSTTRYANKRFNKKYSRFLTGDSVSKASTLFRGVKFEISEIVNEKEVNTGKYNDYRFTMVYVPVDKKSDKVNDKKVHFIKNDKFKFIVGVIYCNIWDDITEREFNKAYVYSGCEGFVAFPAEENSGGGSSSSGGSSSGGSSSGGSSGGGSSSGGSSSSETSSIGNIRTSITDVNNCHIVGNTIFVNGVGGDGLSSFKLNVNISNSISWTASESGVYSVSLLSPVISGGHDEFTNSVQFTCTSKGYSDPSFNVGSDVGRLHITQNGLSGSSIDYRIIRVTPYQFICQCPYYLVNQRKIQVGQTVELCFKYSEFYIRNNGNPSLPELIDVSQPNTIRVGNVRNLGVTGDGAYTFMCTLTGLSKTEGEAEIRFSAGTYKCTVID